MLDPFYPEILGSVHVTLVQAEPFVMVIKLLDSSGEVPFWFEILQCSYFVEIHLVGPLIRTCLVENLDIGVWYDSRYLPCDIHDSEVLFIYPYIECLIMYYV